MDWKAYALLLVAILLSSSGQVSLKQGMAQKPTFSLRELPGLARNLPVIGGFGAYALSTLLYFKVLDSLALSLAYPTVSLGYVLVMFLSRAMFREKISSLRLAALMLICMGVALVGIFNG